MSNVGETPRLWGSGRGVPPDRDDGHPCGSTVPVSARLERCGRVGQGRIPGRRLVGLMSGYARRVAQPPPSGRTGVRSDRTPGAWARGTCHRAVRLSAKRAAVRWIIWVVYPVQAPGTQVPKPPRCTTRAANRTCVLSRSSGECAVWCCPGELNPIFIPNGEQRGGLGWNPPHLRWLVALGASRGL
jgi:hypothetical protein